MAKRIKVYPPGGGEPIEVYEADSVRLVANGWTTGVQAEQPAEQPAADETVTDEGSTDGNTKGKRRHR